MGLIARVHIDFETYSEVDIKSAGLYNYANHPSTRVICMAYRVEGKKVKLWRPGNSEPVFPLPYRLIAHNVLFELEIIKAMGGRIGVPLPEEIECTASEAAMMGYPRSLEGVAKALKLKVQKDKAGKNEMLRVTKPRKPSKNNKETDWFSDHEKMKATYRYCINDVVVEEAIGERTDSLCPYEEKIFLLDKKINERGINFDRELAKGAVELSKLYLDKINTEMFWISGFQVKGISKVKMLKEALSTLGVHTESLNKESVTNLLKGELPPRARRMIELRRDGSMSSVAKYKKMLEWGSQDNRLKYIFLYHGAGTGRWTSKGPQLHNLPQGVKLDKTEAIGLIKNKNLSGFDNLEYSVMDALSSCIRETMTASEGNILAAADFKNIEVRVLAWVAGEKELLDLLDKGEDPYIDMASSIYGVKPEDVTPNQRNIGKMATLGLGYMMASKTFREQVLSRGIDITEDFAKDIVKVYRNKYKKIVALWKRIEKDAIDTKIKGKMENKEGRKYHFHIRDSNLLMNLPSGRNLYFIDPLIEKGRFTSKISHKRVNAKTKQWERRDTYGGMLTENLVQAIARDLLAEAMIRVEEHYDIVLHVHDELVIDVEPEVNKEHSESMVKEKPRWAQDLPTEIDTWYQFRYQKG